MSLPQWLPVAISGTSTTLALIAFAYQVHRARFNQSVDLLFRLENDFFGSGKVLQRAQAAGRLLADGNDFAETEDVLDFFETVAMLTRKKALDLAMVWHTFGYWIVRYHAIARPHIRARQAVDPGVWEDLDWLMVQLRKHQTGRRSTPLYADELNRFLIEESTES